MRAFRAHWAPAGTERRFEDVPTPTPLPDQVLIQVAAIGVNRADLRAPTSGEPFVPGLDVAGTVAAVGSGVLGWKSGDQAMALVRGGYAEYALAHTTMVSAPPKHMTLTAAASIPCVFLTAWYALTKLGTVRPGETVLVHAAGSGVGIAGIQIAHALGASVIATAGSDLKLAKARALVPAQTINYTTQDITTELAQLTSGRGVDVVLDPVGGAVFDATVPALARGGRIVTVGNPAGARGEVDPKALDAKGQKVMPIRVFDETSADRDGNGWKEVKAWFEQQTLRPVIDRTMLWDDAADALRLLEDRSIFGKLVLTVTGPKG